jgi:THO complex subunit 4
LHGFDDVKQEPSRGLASGGTPLKVSNLHYEITEEKLTELFTAYGGVHSCTIGWDRHDRSTGEAVVTMENPKGAEAAISGLHKSNT